MDFITLVFLATIGYFAYRYLFKPNDSDKLTLMSMNSWGELYAVSGPFKRSSMATGLLVQAITLAEVLGANMTVSQFMSEQARKNVRHVETVGTWLDELAQISRELSYPDLMVMPARQGMALVVLKLYNPRQYEAVTTKPPEQWFNT